MQYTGFSPELEAAHRNDETDWVFGAASVPCIALIPEGKREALLPIGEVQAGKQDTGDCASRAPNNIIAPKLTYLYQNDLLHPANKKWLEDKGYVQNGSIDFSDCFVAQNSGTTRAGNSLKAPLEAIRTQGLIPKPMLPLESWMMWDDYMDPKRITPAMRALGLEFLQHFVINYERASMDLFATLLNTDFLDVATHAWPVPENGEYPKNDGDFNHAVAMYKTPPFYIFDNYEEAPGDFIKKLAPNYRFFPYGYRVYIGSEITPEEQTIKLTVFEVLAKYGLLAVFARWWASFTNSKTYD